MVEEIWKDVKNFEGYYQVSNLGNVKSLKRIITKSNGIKQTIRERMLKEFKNPRGYCLVALHCNDVKNTRKVHRLVMINFKGDSELHVNHINGNKKDNRLVNLEYVTNLENQNHKETSLKNKKKYGIYFHKRFNKWHSRIKFNSITEHLGYFEDKEKAYQSFYNAYLETHGVAPW